MRAQIQKYEDFSVQLQVNLRHQHEIKDYIINHAPSAKENILKLFDDFLGFDTNIKCHLLGSLDDFTHVGTGYANSETTLTHLKQNPVYQEALAHPGQICWGVMGTDLLMVRILTDLANGEPLSVFAIVLNGLRINQLLNVIPTEETDVSSLEEHYSILVKLDGEILSSPHREQIGTAITDLLHGGTITDLLQHNQRQQGSFSDRLDNGKVLVTYNQIPAKNWYILSLAHHDFLFKEINNSGLFTFVIELLMILISFGLSYGVYLSISLPLDQVKEAMGKAANGDLTLKVNVQTMDELNALGNSFNQMIRQIAVLIQETKIATASVSERSKILESNSQQSAHSAEAVALAATEITKGTIEQTTEAEKTARQMTVLGEEIDVAAAKFYEVEQITNHTRDLSTQSKSIMEELIQKATETNRITATITTDINGLNKHSEEIRDVTELIANIAEQTNLLSLNAAIEAARAHELGAGFAVVADEVNKLANRTNTAAEAINRILKAIEERAQNSTANVTKAHQIVLDQLEVVSQTQKTFDEIIQGMDLIVKRITDVNDHVQRIKEVKDETTQSILNISAISEESASSSEEVSASIQEQAAISEQVRKLANELNTLAKKLVDSITKFTI
ncbi:MAG TPA: methyl-accepting chemotaxis protein [Firmicutes bacterium]|nr:methyl-accepting chemotaxis protein [Bacillota bacterium]